MRRALLWLALLLAPLLGAAVALPAAPSDSADKCPVCARVLRAAHDLANKSAQGSVGSKEAVFDALVAYCSVPTLGVEDSQFCYNIDSFKAELRRLMVLGADDRRVCNRVLATNPDFCKVAGNRLPSDQQEIKKFSQTKRGIIYI